jgi:hypothetical protein
MEETARRFTLPPALLLLLVAIGGGIVGGLIVQLSTTTVTNDSTLGNEDRRTFSRGQQHRRHRAAGFPSVVTIVNRMEARRQSWARQDKLRRPGDHR